MSLQYRYLTTPAKVAIGFLIALFVGVIGFVGDLIYMLSRN